jgi:hypothetical protein
MKLTSGCSYNKVATLADGTPVALETLQMKAIDKHDYCLMQLLCGKVEEYLLKFASATCWAVLYVVNSLTEDKHISLLCNVGCVVVV